MRDGMKAQYANFISIDFGSLKVAILASHLEHNGEACVVHQGLFRSVGMKYGVISDFDKVESSILNAIYDIEKESGRNVSNVSLCISSPCIKSYYLSYEIKLNHKQITKKDIKNLLSECVNLFKVPNKTIINYFPIEYTVDDNDAIQNPVGMVGEKVGCRLHIIAMDDNNLHNIVNCFANCHITVNEVLPSVYMAGLSALTEDEKTLGSIVIDLGATTTSMAVFLGGEMIYTSCVPMGGWHVTSDIAKILSIGFHSAEKLKILYGAAVSVTADRDNVINLKDIDSNVEYDFVITSHDLEGIISARIEEILLLLKKNYDQLDIDHLISRRIVIVGGGASLRGIREFVARIFSKQARVHSAQIIAGFDNERNNQHVYAASIGLIKNQSHKINNVILSPKRKGLLDWFKERILS